MPTNAQIIEAGPVAVLRAARLILTNASGAGRLPNIGEANALLDLVCGAAANAECGAYDAPPPVGVTPPAIGALIAEALSVWAEQFDAESKLPSPGCIADEDISISGADLVDWFAGWRERVKAAL